MAVHRHRVSVEGSVVSDDRWFIKANCLGEETSGFFILRGDKEQRIKRKAAYRICQASPVQRQCLDYAIVNNETGIWGGTTERERRLMKKTYHPETKPRKRVQGWYQNI